YNHYNNNTECRDNMKDKYIAHNVHQQSNHCSHNLRIDLGDPPHRAQESLFCDCEGHVNPPHCAQES
ncbi:34695_t:CDS:2, partial [Racocetra persica]